jgi:hypothetical protein
MRVTTGPRSRTLTVLVLAGILVSSLLLVVAVAGVRGGGDPDRAVLGPAGTTGQVSGDAYPNPWEAGNAAALEALAEQSRTQADVCSDTKSPVKTTP